jgi:hypothetical protein
VRGSSCLFHHLSRVACAAVGDSAELVGLCLLASDSGMMLRSPRSLPSAAVVINKTPGGRRPALHIANDQLEVGDEEEVTLVCTLLCTYLSRVWGPVPSSHPPSPPIPPPRTPGRYGGTCEGLYRYRGLRPTRVWRFLGTCPGNCFYSPRIEQPIPRTWPAPLSTPLYMSIASPHHTSLCFPRLNRTQHGATTAR